MRKVLKDGVAVGLLCLLALSGCSAEKEAQRVAAVAPSPTIDFEGVDAASQAGRPTVSVGADHDEYGGWGNDLYLKTRKRRIRIRGSVYPAETTVVWGKNGGPEHRVAVDEKGKFEFWLPTSAEAGFHVVAHGASRARATILVERKPPKPKTNPKPRVVIAAAPTPAPTAAPTQEASCDSNYEGACLDPSSPDYDCAGGSGDGPDYTGAVRVVGDDPFDLDRDGDGYACEAG